MPRSTGYSSSRSSVNIALLRCLIVCSAPLLLVGWGRAVLTFLDESLVHVFKPFSPERGLYHVQLDFFQQRGALIFRDNDDGADPDQILVDLFFLKERSPARIYPVSPKETLPL